MQLVISYILALFLSRVLIHIIQAAIYPDLYYIYKLFENANKWAMGDQ